MGANINIFSKKEKLEFVPQKWEQGFGQLCMSCKSRTVSSQSISLCRCYLFCHEKCFLKQFSPYIRTNQQIRCIRCDQIIELSYTYTVEWICIKRPLFIFSVAIAFLGLLTLLILTAAGIYRSVMSDTMAYIIFGFSIIFFAGALVCSMRRKYVQLQNVKCKNTNMCDNAQSLNESNMGQIKDLEDIYSEKETKDQDILKSTTSFSSI